MIYTFQVIYQYATSTGYEFDFDYPEPAKRHCQGCRCSVSISQPSPPECVNPESNFYRLLIATLSPICSSSWALL